MTSVADAFRSVRIERLNRAPAACFLIVLTISAVFSFWNLGGDTVHEWDEARHGQVALEMLRTGDYINYYYGGQPDTWLVKPPLAIWSIAVSYRIFGLNEFALRFPSALAIVLTTLVFFALVRTYAGTLAALMSCLIMLSCKGLIGSHVGRTGDTDALLVLFLVVFAWFALRSIDFGARRSPVAAGLALGLAFYTKSTACIFLIPGILLYAGFRGKLRQVLTNPYSWVGLALFGLTISSWYALISLYGHTFESLGEYGRNAWQKMFLYDTWHRFTADLEGHGKPLTPGYLLRCLDLRFSPWNYLLYLSGLVGLFRLVKGRRMARIIVWFRERGIEQVSLCLVLTFGVIFTLSRSKLNWYVAPVIPFLSVLAYSAYTWVTGARSFFRHALVLLVIVFLGIQGERVNRSKRDAASLAIRANAEAIRAAGTVLYVGNLQQDHRLYLSWNAESVLPADEPLPPEDHLEELDGGARLFRYGGKNGGYIYYVQGPR